jgi:putative transposase
MRILAYCLMSNHWHLIFWPRRAEDLSKFMQWISTTHVRRWREHRQKVGEGHLYQGRFKSFPVQDDHHHLLAVMRYAEANPLRAKIVEKAEAWAWSSFGGGTAKDGTRVQLSLKRGRPYGTERWTEKTAKRLGLESTLHDPWRPKKKKARKRKRTGRTK